MGFHFGFSDCVATCGRLLDFDRRLHPPRGCGAGGAALTTVRGELAKAGEVCPAILYSVGSVSDPDHEAADALRRQSSGAAGPFSRRREGHAITRVAATSDHHRRPFATTRPGDEVLVLFFLRMFQGRTGVFMQPVVA